MIIWLSSKVQGSSHNEQSGYLLAESGLAMGGI
jgi:hypothetical protein